MPPKTEKNDEVFYKAVISSSYNKDRLSGVRIHIGKKLSEYFGLGKEIRYVGIRWSEDSKKIVLVIGQGQRAVQLRDSGGVSINIGRLVSLQNIAFHDGFPVRVSWESERKSLKFILIHVDDIVGDKVIKSWHKKQGTVNVPVRLDKNVLKILQNTAKHEDRSVGSLIGEAIEAYYERVYGKVPPK